MTTQIPDPEFPCSLYVLFFSRSTNPTLGNADKSSIIDLPLPTPRLASAALQALRVDKELSPLVRRSFSTISAASALPAAEDTNFVRSPEETILRTEYKATTNRMLRVAVNGFMESLSVVLGVMEELDVDVLGVETGEE
jgi:EKC/KEOPS complex subunit PCC1/LAGE3